MGVYEMNLVVKTGDVYKWQDGYISGKDMTELKELGEFIRQVLECNTNGNGVPCINDRLSLTRDMKRYLKLTAKISQGGAVITK